MFYDEMVAWCRAQQTLATTKMAADAIKERLLDAQDAEQTARAALDGAALGFVATGGDPDGLPRGMAFVRAQRLEYDADEVLLQAIARGADNLVVYPSPRLNKRRFKELQKADKLPWAQCEEVPAPYIAVRLDPRAIAYIVAEDDRLRQLEADGVPTGEVTA